MTCPRGVIGCNCGAAYCQRKRRQYPYLTHEEELRDFHDCYYAAVREMRRRWLAGEPLPPEWTPKHGKPIILEDEIK